MSAPMRFGLVGTAFWAQEFHGRGIHQSPDAELVGVWGRDRAKTKAAADRLEVAAYDDFQRLLDDVDAVSFAVPPHVQATLAVTAAQSGRHLLLEKPLATSVEQAETVQSAVEAAGVATALFVTGRYTPERRAWAAEMSRTGPWHGASALWLGSAFAPDSPFDTPWRHEKGALWDAGPHLLAALEDALGPVDSVLAAVPGGQGVVHLVLRHAGGATSLSATTLEAPPAASRSSLIAWGEPGAATLPAGQTSSVDALATAVSELVAAARSGEALPVDVRYGVHLARIIAEAERLLALGDAEGTVHVLEQP